MVYNTALGFCHQVSIAEEITQDVFTKIFMNAGSFKGKSEVRTWITRITINTSINHVQKANKHRYQSEDMIHLVDYDHPGVVLLNKENAKYLAIAIDALPTNQKTAFVLAFIEDFPRQEVADIMEISLKATESLLQRAKTNLRLKLIEYYPNRRKI